MMDTVLDRRSQPPAHDARLPWRFIGGVAATLVGALLAFYLLMHPTPRDVVVLAGLFAVTAALSALVGFGAYRLGWIERSPGILWMLVAGYLLANLLTFLSIGVTAWLMFTSYHDLMLATVLLLFASGIAISLGYFLSATLRDGVLTISGAAHRIAAGDLHTRVQMAGSNELSDLAGAFNAMALRLQEAAEKQQQAEQLRRDLIAWVGHDLRTPLASIRTIVEALADNVVEDPATIERYLRTAQRDIRSLSLLIDDLFEMAQLDAGGLPLDRCSISISDLLSDSIEQFTAQAEAQGIHLHGSAGPGVDPVVIDAQKIGRALANLIDNALRYTGRGGEVAVSAARVAEGIRVEVADTGEGIAPPDLDHVFERFYRGEKSRSRATGGAGLGLAIMRSIVEAHGGRVGVESTPGAGTRFFFILPPGP
jgi:signal transduction histidine kinase